MAMETKATVSSQSQEGASSVVDPQVRLRELEAAIRRHREEKASTPACTCWMTPVEKLDAALYACLDFDDPPVERVTKLEDAIRLNRDGKKDVEDCPCWGNAPQMVDADLFALLDRVR
jgi:hypothetical protein